MSKTNAENASKTRTLKPLPHKGYSPNVSINGVGGVVGVYQYSLPLHRIELQEGYLLATNPSSLSHDWAVDKLNSLLDYLLSAFRLYLGAERFHAKRYREALSMLLANLLHAHRRAGQLIVPRHTWHIKDHGSNPGKFTTRLLNPLCDYLAAAGLITLVIGPDNEYQGVCSWAVADPQLIARISQARIILNPKKQLAVVRDGDGKTIRRPRSRKKNLQLKRLEKPVRLHNRTWTKNYATLDGQYLVPWLTRIFNVSVDYGGRFYGDYQNLPSDDRKRIRINGQITVEHDYKSIHFNLLYGFEGLQFVGDPYQLEGFDRETGKQASLRLLNSDNLAAFKANVTRSGDINVQRTFAEYSINRGNYDRLRAIGLKADEPYKPKSLKGFIEGIKPGTKGDDLLEAIKQKHSAIAHWFGSPRIGLLLQRQDSDVMARALSQLARVPVLPVHDSIRCRRDDSKKVLDAMHSAYREITGFGITVETKAL